MKKLLTVLVALFVVVSMFAAVEKPFTLGPNVTYKGTVYFGLTANASGVDISGSLDWTLTLPFSPAQDTQAGATFKFSYAPFNARSQGSLTLSSIQFSTPYFAIYYSVSTQRVSDYFTGWQYYADPQTWATNFAADYGDSIKVTFPAAKGFELYLIDNKTEIDNPDPWYVNWLSDMVLAKYSVEPFTLVGGFYVKDGYYTAGAQVKGTVDLGFFKPTIDVFAGQKDVMTDAATMVYGLTVSGALTPVTGLTLKPTFKYTENLKKLVYRSDTISDGKYVQLQAIYTTTATPVTLTVNVTPKYDIATEKFTLKLSEASLKVAVAPMTIFAKVVNANVLDNTKPYRLYTEASVDSAPVFAIVRVNWNDVTKFEELGYKVEASYALTSNVKLSGFYGNLFTDDYGEYTVVDETFWKTWGVTLSYKANF